MRFCPIGGELSRRKSHTDWLRGYNQTQSKGYYKITAFCEVAKIKRCDWAWVDTCCIDKTSSAELSESINAMFNWYKSAEICIVYLEDVNKIDDLAAFESSRWFTRGWTLQELLAPKDVEFCTRFWEKIGSKREATLCRTISKVTGIPQQVLKGVTSIHDVSVGRRMSWAAGRSTTRTEDVAYSLLGLFDVNMPMIYGEGQKAFHRLQKCIMEQIDDDTLFAWEDQQPKSKFSYSGLLAGAPIAFTNGGGLVCVQSISRMENPPVTVTSRGAEFNTELVQSQTLASDSSRVFVLSLRCGRIVDQSAYLDVQVAENMLEHGRVEQCAIALHRKTEAEPFNRIHASASVSEIASLFPHMRYVPHKRFYVRIQPSAVAYFGRNDAMREATVNDADQLLGTILARRDDRKKERFNTAQT